MGLGLLPAEGRDLILAGALLSITLNPLMFAIVDAILALFPAAQLSRRGEEPALSRPAGGIAGDAERLEARATELRLEAQEFVTKFPMFASLDPEASEELHALFRARQAALANA